MRPAVTVLEMLQKRGQRGLPLYDLYRQLFNPDLYLRAYAKLYSNDGAMTTGATEETVDGMARAKIDTIIAALRAERYQWTPVRRTYVPKKNGKKRPLGLPTWSDKLLQEVVRSLLEAYYEPQMRHNSHGFRPGRGCHTALRDIQVHWKGTRWFLEGDIAACFERIDHQILLSILAQHIPDQRFLRLLKHLLQAGYLEQWQYHRSWSGCPQGGVVSPILANLYLDRLDRYVEDEVLPRYQRGARRKAYLPYTRLIEQADALREQGQWQQAHAVLRQAQRLPSGDPSDPTYRRLRSIRYADDILLGFVGPKHEAEQIKAELATFLQEQLHLTLSQDKTLITHAGTQAARFLGYEIVARYRNDKLAYDGRRRINASIGLRIPAEVIRKHCAKYRQHGHPARRWFLTHDTDYTIMSLYQAEYRGLVQYYLLADNVRWLTKVHWAMKQSLLHTLAAKHQQSAQAMYPRYEARVETADGPRVCLQITVEREGGKRPLVTRFGGLPLRRNQQARLVDLKPAAVRFERNELLSRLRADTCELCGAQGNCEVHHVRKLADLKQAGRKEKPLWVQKMSARRRKTLIVCQACHRAIHAGKPPGKPLEERSLESRVR